MSCDLVRDLHRFTLSSISVILQCSADDCRDLKVAWPETNYAVHGVRSRRQPRYGRQLQPVVEAMPQTGSFHTTVATLVARIGYCYSLPVNTYR